MSSFGDSIDFEVSVSISQIEPAIYPEGTIGKDIAPDHGIAMLVDNRSFDKGSW